MDGWNVTTTYFPLSIGIMFCFLIYFAWIDIKEKRIPNKGLVIFFITGLGLSLLKGQRLDTVLVFSLKDLVYGSAPLFLIHYLSKGSIGFGDVKLFGVLGSWIGSYGIFPIFALTFILGGIYALFLLGFKKGDKSSEIPLAPFVLAATAVLFFLHYMGINFLNYL